jgi:hypothetical protein
MAKRKLKRTVVSQKQNNKAGAMPQAPKAGSEHRKVLSDLSQKAVYGDEARVLIRRAIDHFDY